MSPVYTAFLFTISLASALRRSCVVEDKETLKCNYFPNRISDEISRVRVVDFIGPNESMAINSSDFNVEGWKNVKYLEISNSLSYSDLKFTAEPFSDLKRLEELQLHLGHFYLDPDTFVGLNSVKSLDVSDCVRLSFEDLLQSLNGTNKLPNLTKLTVSRLNAYHPPNMIDESFGQILQQKMLAYLDMSNTEITAFHFGVFKYLRYLKVFNASGATFGNTFQNDFDFSDLRNIVVDLSHMTLPKRMRPSPGRLVISNIVVKNPTIHAVGFIIFIEAKVVNTSSIVPTLSSIWIHNTTIIIDKPIQVLLQRVITKNNNLKYLDLHVEHFCNNCIASSAEKIDLSYNGLQFINPSLANFAPNIKILDLSFNQLFKMAKNNSSFFEILLKSLSYLQFVSLSANNLSVIPVNMFEENFALETIDLSRNELYQVTFCMSHLEKLKVLDLQNNYIHILDEVSLGHLDSIPENTEQNETQTTVLLRFNPILCSECDSKPFITWLLKTPLVNIKSQNLQCRSENGVLSTIDEDSIQNVQSICDRVTIIIASGVSGTCTIFVIEIISIIAHTYWKRARLLAKKNMMMNLLRNGEDQYEFVAYLAYSDANEDFVMNNVIDNLDENLKRMIKTERDLICTKDRHSRPGYPIFEEIGRCFKRASVVLFVISNDFRLTSECYMVINLVLQSNKPIIFMLKGNVDESDDILEQIMSDMVKNLYHVSTKIQWREGNGLYTLEMSWDHVCNVILDHSV